MAVLIAALEPVQASSKWLSDGFDVQNVARILPRKKIATYDFFFLSGTVQKAFFVISPKCMKRQKKMIANITETAHSTSNQSFRWNAFTAKMTCGTSHNDNPTLSHIPLK